MKKNIPNGLYQNQPKIDHIIPVMKNGKNVESNCQILCKKCNVSKNNKIESEGANG